MYYRQGIPEIDLYIERETDRTPVRGRYYVFSQGQMVGSSRGYRTLKLAQHKYSELLNASGYAPPQLALPARESRKSALIEEAQYDFTSRAEFYWASSSAHRRRK